MAQGEKSKKLFKVAKEFNVSTQTIVETLKGEGYTVEGRPNSNITPEMYGVLEELYETDKEKSAEHERSREEYEERKTAYRQNRNESVTLDNLLEPIDEMPLEPLDEENQETEAPVAEEEEKEAAPQEEPKKTISEKKTDKDIKQPEAQRGEKKTDLKEKENKTGEKPGKTKEPKKEAPKTDKKQKEESKEEPENEDELYADIIRAQTEKLRGTRVLGTINISEPEQESDKPKVKNKSGDEEKTSKKKKKKRFKRSKRSESEDGEATGKKRRKKSRKSSQVDEEHVEQKMKETMQLIQSSPGKKRQKRRRQKREEMAAEREQQAAEKEEKEKSILEVTEFVTVSDLADMLNVNPTEIITLCMNIGIMASINQRLDASTIELVGEEFGREVHFIDADELIEDIEEEVEESEEDLEPRAPVVTVMGHVDHGKTSLLDYVRKTKVAAGEAGGITQHIGAYEVEVGNKRKITFLDTPGHEAFTAMRARGAQITDIVILVVAADDSVMPQTVEAINHAQAAGVSIVVAINKIDKPGANPDKIRQQLSEHNVVVEEWGGNYQCAEVSAKTGNGIEELLDKVIVESDLMELKANPNRHAVGIVLESRVDKGKGVVANILVQKGTLHIGDPFVAGQYFGRVRAMENELGHRVAAAGPSTPVQVTGFDGLPQAGDKLVSMDDEKQAKEVAQQRQQIKREQDLRKVKHITLDDLSRRMALGEVAELSIIIKGDVDGSIEALSGALQKLSTDEVEVNIIHTGVGAITESDVLLASASDAIIIGFQVRPSTNARKLAEREEIDIRLFSVIYDAVDAVRDAMEGLLSPEINEKIVATVEVRNTFKVPNAGTVAGCYVTDGKITRNTKVRLIREGIVIYDGEIDSLKRFKDDVKDVASGYECGISIKNYNDIKVGDVIEGYEVTEVKRTLADG